MAIKQGCVDMVLKTAANVFNEDGFHSAMAFLVQGGEADVVSLGFSTEEEKSQAADALRRVVREMMPDMVCLVTEAYATFVEPNGVNYHGDKPRGFLLSSLRTNVRPLQKALF